MGPSVTQQRSKRPKLSQPARHSFSSAADQQDNAKALYPCRRVLKELMHHQMAWPFLKPVDPVDLKACADRIREHFRVKMIENGDFHRKLEVTTSGQRHFIRHSEILHVEASGSYACIYKTDGTRLMVSKNLKYVESLIDNPKFVRVHNSQLVHLNKIRQCNYRTNSITLVNGKEIALAVRKREDLRRRMAELLSSEDGTGLDASVA